MSASNVQQHTKTTYKHGMPSSTSKDLFFDRVFIDTTKAPERQTLRLASSPYQKVPHFSMFVRASLAEHCSLTLAIM